MQGSWPLMQIGSTSKGLCRRRCLGSLLQEVGSSAPANVESAAEGTYTIAQRGEGRQREAGGELCVTAPRDWTGAVQEKWTVRQHGHWVSICLVLGSGD